MQEFPVDFLLHLIKTYLPIILLLNIILTIVQVTSIRRLMHQFVDDGINWLFTIVVIVNSLVLVLDAPVAFSAAFGVAWIADWIHNEDKGLLKFELCGAIMYALFLNLRIVLIVLLTRFGMTLLYKKRVAGSEFETLLKK